MTTSVALCTFNGEKFLRQQIDSILNQSIKVDEIVVCDDRSTDSTLKILEEYQQNFPNVFKIHKNENNLGSIKNFEKAIRLCENEIIFLSDQDDEWLPEKVNDYCKFFSDVEDVSVLCSNGFAMDEEGKILDKLSVWDAPEIISENGSQINFFESIAFIRNIATGASMAIRKSFLPEILPVPQTENIHHDEWIALVASYYNKFHFLERKYFKYRFHQNQLVGGVFFDNTEVWKSYLKKFYSGSNQIKDFKMYRKHLRSLKNSMKKFAILAEKSQIQNQMLEQCLLMANERYYNLKIQVKKEFPIQSMFLKK